MTVGLAKITNSKNLQLAATSFCHTLTFKNMSDGQVCPKKTFI